MRAASVKYANSSELTTLAQKLDHLFNAHLSPMIASKNKAKSNEEEVSKIALICCLLDSNRIPVPPSRV